MKRDLMQVAKPRVTKVRSSIMDYDTLLQSLAERERGNLEKQRQTHETKLGLETTQRWSRLACVLRSLATGPMQSAGANAMQFFIPDGRYRKQVFALQVLADSGFVVYTPNVVAQAVAAGILAKTKPAEDSNAYHLADSDDTLAIDELDIRSPNPEVFYKDLTGWNRKAMRITLPPEASRAQVQAAEQLCMLAAEEWNTATD